MLQNFSDEFRRRAKMIEDVLNSEVKIVNTSESLNTNQKHEDRWLVYKFSIPIKYLKIVAIGFESKATALAFIKTHLKRYDRDGIELPKTSHENGITYTVVYDVAKESSGPLNLFYNDCALTTIGNDLRDIEKAWRN
jgi:hypothetical protein